MSDTKIFVELVGSEEDDLEGLLAYALFAVERSEWEEKFRDDNQDNPVDIDYQQYYNSFTPKRLDSLRGNARDALSVFAWNFLEDNIERIKEEAVDKSVVAEVRRQNNFWRSAFSSATGNVVFTVILFVLLLLVATDLSVQGLLERLFGSAGTGP